MGIMDPPLALPLAAHTSMSVSVGFATLTSLRPKAEFAGVWRSMYIDMKSTAADPDFHQQQEGDAHMLLNTGHGTHAKPTCTCSSGRARGQKTQRSCQCGYPANTPHCSYTMVILGIVLGTGCLLLLMVLLQRCRDNASPNHSGSHDNGVQYTLNHSQANSSTYTPQGGVLNASDFQSWIMHSSRTFSSLILIQGNYSVSATAGSAQQQQHNSHLYLEMLQDVQLDMSGVHLFLEDRHKTALYVSKLRNVTFRGVSLHYTIFPTNQAYLRAISTDGKSLDVQVMKGYPLDDWRSGQAFPCYVFDSVSRWWKPNTTDMYPLNVTGLPGDGDMFRLHFPGPVGPDQQDIAVGDPIACRQLGGSFVIHTQDSLGIHWSDITLYGGPSFGFFEGFAENEPVASSTGNTYTHCSVRRPEMPRGATDGALLSTSADGFHSAGMPIGPTVSNSYFEGMPDDGIAIHGHFSLIAGAFPVNNSIVVANQHGHVFYGVGNVLRIYDIEFRPAGVATIVSVTDITQHYHVPHTRSRTLWKLNLTTCAFMLVQVREALPTGCGFDYIVSSPNRTGNGFLLQGNHIHYHRARGMLIKASDGTIQDNIVEGSTMAGLLMTPELYWGEADYVHNIVVENNTFISIGYTIQGVAALAIGALDANRHYATGYGHTNISVIGNRFLNNSNVNMWITSADTVRVQDNVFINAFQHPPWADCCFPLIPHTNLVWLSESKNIVLERNCVSAAGPSMTKILNATASVSGSGLANGITRKTRC
ncbi:uncharacterized protein LOC135810105 [Sycon ciliatum]|uniref:uncharacterized protein LOC135810105 n=1 Tax=Sycon ciliatum TaxID=27933 RepID=UPI0031F6BD01